MAHEAGVTIYDQGLRAYLVKIYNYMAAALALTGGTALFAAQSETLLNALYTIDAGRITGMTALGWVVLFAPLVMVLAFGIKVRSMSLGAAQALFWVYAGVMGLSLASLFLAYTGESIARVFFISAGMFAGMSLYGYTTKRDLTQLGSFLMMGVIGLIIAMLVNMFLGSETVHFVTSVLGVAIFAGLTAFDTQRLKELYDRAASEEIAGKTAIMGALSLYLDFINIFLSLLHLMGERR
jgi:FtsH-binding integral membrane protein